MALDMEYIQRMDTYFTHCHRKKFTSLLGTTRLLSLYSSIKDNKKCKESEFSLIIVLIQNLMEQPKQIQISGFEVSPKTHKASSLWKRKKRLKNALDPKRNIINKQTDLGGNFF
jgi:hypothetical protein